LPQAKPDNSVQAWWDSTDTTEAVRVLVLEWPVTPEVLDGDFYSSSTNVVVRTAVQKLEAPAGRIRVRKEVEKGEGTSQGIWPNDLNGLVIEKNAGGDTRAYQAGISIKNAPGLPAPADASPSGRNEPFVATTKKPLLLWLGAAFLG